MKRILLIPIIATIFLFSSCERIEYNSDDKIAFEGTLKRFDGTPLSNVPVHISVILLNNGTGGDYDDISYTETDENGHFLMIFPKPSNFDYIELHFNQSMGYDNYLTPIQSLSSFEITNILPQDLNSLEINFGEHYLYTSDETTLLTITFTNATNLPYNLPFTSYSGYLPNDAIYYNMSDDIDFPQDYNGLYQYYWEQTEPGTYTRTVSVAKNQTITFSYLNSGFDTNTVEIPIGNDPVNYTINY